MFNPLEDARVSRGITTKKDRVPMLSLDDHNIKQLVTVSQKKIYGAYLMIFDDN